MWKRLLFVVLIGWGAHTWWSARAVTHSPGVLAPDAPMQDDGEGAAFEHRGYRITPLARFEIKARVLSRSDYQLGRESDLSPTDLAMGWGRMSDEAVLQKIDIGQSGRFYHWSVQEFPIPQHEIETSSANMHLIPADSTVARKLDSVRKGQVVQLRGSLVRADASDGWHWISSLRRTDTGAGACELIWVEGLTIL
jgi:hypothetical protein